MSILSIPTHWLLMGHLRLTNNHLTRTIDGAPEHLARCRPPCVCENPVVQTGESCDCVEGPYEAYSYQPVATVTVTTSCITRPLKYYPSPGPFIICDDGAPCIDLDGDYVLNCGESYTLTIAAYVCTFNHFPGLYDYYYGITLSLSHDVSGYFHNVTIGLTSGTFRNAAGTGNPYPTPTLGLDSTIYLNEFDGWLRSRKATSYSTPLSTVAVNTYDPTLCDPVECTNPDYLYILCNHSIGSPQDTFLTQLFSCFDISGSTTTAVLA